MATAEHEIPKSRFLWRGGGSLLYAHETRSENMQALKL